MLGRFSRGMQLSIPARFRSQNQAVDVDNVVVAIEYFNKDMKRVIRLLEEVPMNKIEVGEYGFDYTIPQDIDTGNYIVRIKAKQAGSKSGIVEATDHFEVVDSSDIPQVTPDKKEVELEKPAEHEKIEPLTLANPPKINKVSGASGVEDIILDVYNSPVGGVHVNVFDKNSFIPNSPSNLKIASAITDSEGKFFVSLKPGDYVFSYKGINLREFREFRKVQ